jgi:hypothetical protein
MAADKAEGVLAIWNDIRADRRTDFEFWYRNEHFPERLGVPGFRLGRRYELASDGAGPESGPRYFCYYLGDTAGTFTSPAYQERLNNPTALTQSMMSGAFHNMSRTVCRRAAIRGRMSSGLAVTARFHRPVDQAQALALLDTLSAAEGIARAELWSATDAAQGAPAKEEELRGGDRKIAACLLVETLRLADAARVRSQVRERFGDAAETGVYALVCELASAG